MTNDDDTSVEATDRWPEEMAALRPVLLASGLTEECAPRIRDRTGSRDR